MVKKTNNNKYKFFTKNGFEKYIKSLPRYGKRPGSKYDSPIKDYLIKNRSASLADIVKGCIDHGLKSESQEIRTVFYRSLKGLVQDGLVTKDDAHKIYFWNYKE